MVASKLLHDDGEEDEVFNEEWANSAGMEKKDLNRLEIEFLSNIDWNCNVSPNQFEKMTDRLEKSVIQRQITRRKDGWTTYSDINVLSKQIHLQIIWERLANVAFQVTAVCIAAYAASLVTMLGTCYALTKANLGPSAVSQSLNTLKSAVTSSTSSSSSTMMMMSVPSSGPASQNSSIPSSEARIPPNLSNLDTTTFEHLNSPDDSDASSLATFVANSIRETQDNEDCSGNVHQIALWPRTLHPLLEMKPDESRCCHNKKRKPPYELKHIKGESKFHNHSDSATNVLPANLGSSNETFIFPDRLKYDDIDDHEASMNMITNNVENQVLNSMMIGSLIRAMISSPSTHGLENDIPSYAVLSSPLAPSKSTQFSSFCCSSEKSSCENNWNNMFHDPPHDLFSFFNPCHKKEENALPGDGLHNYHQQNRNALFHQVDRRTIIGL